MKPYDYRPIEKLGTVVGLLAVVAAGIVTLGGAAYALIDGNAYTIEDYLGDLKTLVLALAALLIAMELPMAIHRRLNRERS